jgi:integrase
MEARGSVKDPETNTAPEGIPAADGITVAEASEKFLGNNTHLSPERLKKYRLQFNWLIDFLERHNIYRLQDVNLELITDFRAKWHATWKLGVGTICLNIQMLREFFRFCIKRNWIEKNPASDLEMPKGKGRPSLPFSQEEWTNILSAFPLYEEQTRSANGTRLLYALVLLMRFSGMRIGDTVRSETSWIQGDRISFRTEKNAVNVCNKLLEFVPKALFAATRKSERCYFWSGTSSLHSAVGKWQRRLQVLFRLAGVRNGHSHRFKDSYAFDMAHNGRMTLEELRQALGHSSARTTERYYSHWILERQERLEAKQDLAWAEQRAIQALYKNSDRVN